MKQNNQWTNDAKKFLNPIITSCGYVWIIDNLEVSICHIQIDILKSLQLVIDSTFTFDKVTSFQWWTNHKHNHVVRINVSVWPILRLLKLKKKQKSSIKPHIRCGDKENYILSKWGVPELLSSFFLLHGGFALVSWIWIDQVKIPKSKLKKKWK